MVLSMGHIKRSKKQWNSFPFTDTEINSG